MPSICAFYPGMNPVVYRQITIGELNDLVDHMNEVRRKEQAADQKRRR